MSLCLVIDMYNYILYQQLGPDRHTTIYNEKIKIPKNLEIQQY